MSQCFHWVLQDSATSMVYSWQENLLQQGVGGWSEYLYVFADKWNCIKSFNCNKNIRQDPLIINVHNQAKLQVWLPSSLTQACWNQHYSQLGSRRGSLFVGGENGGERGDGKCSLQAVGRQTENRSECQQKAIIPLKWMGFCTEIEVCC